MDDKEFLEKIKNGKMSIDEGLLYLKDYGYKELLLKYLKHFMKEGKLSSAQEQTDINLKLLRR